MYRLRFRARRRAVLAAALALCALPATAQAGLVEEAADGTISYRAAAGETNGLLVTDVNRVIGRARR